MTQSLPVGETLNETFQFALNKWVTVLRFLWLPLLLTILMFGGLAVLAIDFGAVEDGRTFERIEDMRALLRMPPSLILILGFMVYVLALIFYSGAMASLFRLVTLGEDQPGMFQLRADGPAMRVFAASIIQGLINFGIWLVAVGVAFTMSGQSPFALVSMFGDLVALFAAAANGANIEAMESAPIMRVVGALGLSFLFAIVPWIYVNVRLAPFLAGSASENRLLLMGSLALTKSRFWQVFLTLLVFVLLIIVLSVVFEITSGIFELMSQFMINFGGLAAIIGGLLAFVIIAISVYFQVFVTGLQAAVQSIIYRRLKTGE